MKTSILIALFLTLANTVYGQNRFLKDTLIKQVSVFDDDTIYKYVDFEGFYNELPTPKDIKGEIPEVLGIYYKPEDQTINLTKEIFNTQEINSLINSMCIINCISTTSGQIVSASFKFSEKEPEICMEKFVIFSQQFKEKITINTVFDEEIGEEGYIQSSYGLFIVLKRLCIDK